MVHLTAGEKPGGNVDTADQNDCTCEGVDRIENDVESLQFPDKFADQVALVHDVNRFKAAVEKATFSSFVNVVDPVVFFHIPINGR